MTWLLFSSIMLVCGSINAIVIFRPTSVECWSNRRSSNSSCQDDFNISLISVSDNLQTIEMTGRLPDSGILILGSNNFKNGSNYICLNSTEENVQSITVNAMSPAQDNNGPFCFQQVGQPLLWATNSSIQNCIIYIDPENGIGFQSVLLVFPELAVSVKYSVISASTCQQQNDDPATNNVQSQGITSTPTGQTKSELFNTNCSGSEIEDNTKYCIPCESGKGLNSWAWFAIITVISITNAILVMILIKIVLNRLPATNNTTSHDEVDRERQPNTVSTTIQEDSEQMEYDQDITGIPPNVISNTTTGDPDSMSFDSLVTRSMATEKDSKGEMHGGIRQLRTHSIPITDEGRDERCSVSLSVEKTVNMDSV